MIGFSFPWRKESILTSFSSFLLSFLPSFLSSFLLPSFFSSLPPSILQAVDKLGTTQSTCMPRVRAVDVPCVHHMRTLLPSVLSFCDCDNSLSRIMNFGDNSSLYHCHQCAHSGYSAYGGGQLLVIWIRYFFFFNLLDFYFQNRLLNNKNQCLLNGL